ncbi:adenosine deaminase [Candidatus Woesearchaeota archaeon]|jgi:adenosine deaminase|nr:adenosine deaminase [Candidatus Woesearchaeota archaeon]
MNSFKYIQPLNKYKKKSDLEFPTIAWIKKIPKTDIHVHLGGSMRITTLIDEAKRQKIKLPSYNIETLKKLVIKENALDLEEYLKAFHLTESVMKSERTLKRVAFELVVDCVSENVRLLEVRFAPTNYVTPKLKLPQIIEAVLEGLDAGKKYCKEKLKKRIHVGLIVCGIRTDKSATEEAVRIAINYYGQGVVGFDIAGAEYGHRPKELEKVCMPVFKHHVPVTIHAGEAYGAKSISESLVYLRAKRIGHGTHVLGSTLLVREANTSRLPFEVCISSNVHTKTIPSIQAHPIRQMMMRGLRVCINTDNRLVSNTNITKEMYLLVNHLGFRKGDLKKLVKNGVKAAFIDKDTTDEILTEFDTSLDLL